MATNPRMRVTWTGIALAAAFGAAAICASLALLVRSGLEFALAILAAAAILLAAYACRRATGSADEAHAKLSEDVTAISRRLLRLENRAPDGSVPVSSLPAAPLAAIAADLDTVTRVVTSLADAVGAHDRRLETLEETSARTIDETSPAGDTSSQARHAEVPAEGQPRSTPPDPEAEGAHERRPPADVPVLGPPRDEDAGTLRHPGVQAAELSSREDFAKAASVILDRLRRGSPQPSESPDDEAVIAAIDAGGVELHLQPVVTLPQRRTAFYDVFPHLRLADGRMMDASEVADLVLRRGLRSRLDAFTLAKARLIARHLAGRRSTSRMAVRLSRASLGDVAFVQGAARLLQDGTAERIILVIDHAEIDQLSGYETAALDALSSLGTTPALDAVRDLDQDWSALARRGFGIAMLDARTILGSRPHGITLAFAEEAARAGVKLVATGIDDDALVPDLLDFDLPLAVGSGLAPPRPVRSEVLAPPSAAEAPEAKREAASPVAAAEGPVSFRDFLRRAG
ncbi:EAL domain-containing protein [Enterovirga rhinocerotis]|uniref:Cyclic-di-GMP phosphodiesterase TipF (Flagellum assembly factor) n=1 Tax=Enterovirga rhinocerotis TaxID=1339210 RepID=A0A4R7BQT6_9HYPH|nr:EAL domain-containing protein [Enterovirga rhinocerotis]TDR88020.1 cyclic-di-GMP phosphodiesterase TipF (flagellum assembly factor) [Enterovirga rhinocerotis]